MCGLVGVLSRTGETGVDFNHTIRRMADTLVHRGPDDSGLWSDPAQGIALAHRRLSVLDLTPAGHQPMGSASGRWFIAYNGEIYNHLELRELLAQEGYEAGWHGHSDTETLLAAIDAWGLEKTLSRTVGMFALALWDREEHTLWLARDRFGEKPLYYGWSGGNFIFGSELKALRAFHGFSNPICRHALTQYLRFTYVPAPRSILEGIYKLEPGCLLRIHRTPPPCAPSTPLRPPATYGSMMLRRWWSLADVVEEGARAPVASEEEALEMLDARLRDSVALQSLADVPLGAFLSGGVDSSTIVALMQQQASAPVKTFTVGFEESGFDESPHARAVAGHLGTDHSELFVTAEQARSVIRRLPMMYDEPFADSSQIPTHLVCSAARQQVTVALSGDAGDELFGGYKRYFWGARFWNRVAWLPYPARRALGAAIRGIPTAGWDALGQTLNHLFPGTDRTARIGDKAHRLAARLSHVRSLEDLYLSLVSEWPLPDRLVRGSDGPVREPPSLLVDPLPGTGVEDDRLRMMYRDSLTYLTDDILCKVDRASMAVSLETRVPLLDHRVVELAWRLPLSMKIQGNEGKWALRQILYRHVPRELIERPKAGFGIPVGQWLRGPLRDWAESLLNEYRLEREGYLNPKPIRETWAQHLSGSHDWTPRLWSVLMFQAWLEANS